jgi:hypothetical protein
MLWWSLGCGGKDRGCGLPPVSRFDLLLGTVLLVGAAVALWTVAVVLALAALTLLRLLGTPSEAMVALVLAGAAAGAAAVRRARSPY